jgi:hypothetical protein
LEFAAYVIIALIHFNEYEIKFSILYATWSTDKVIQSGKILFSVSKRNEGIIIFKDERRKHNLKGNEENII